MKLKTYLLIWSILLSMTPSFVLAENSKNLAVFYEFNKSIEKEYDKFVEKDIKTIGYNLINPHHRVNDEYKTKYGSTVLDLLSFMPVANDDLVMSLFNIDPRIAGFSPFNMLIYKKLDEKTTHVGHLTPEAMLDITGVTNKEVREKFIASFKPLDDMVEKKFGGKKVTIPFAKTPKDTMLNFEYEFDRPDDMDDFVDEFQNKFENAFINKKYLIAGFYNFMDTDNGEDILKDYDIFWAYSLCHFGYSYGMFDTKGARADAGLFAPCTMYVFVRKGSNKLVIGMPKLVNVMDSLNITDPKRVALVEQLDKEIPQILTDFGMVAVENVNPLTQTPKKLLVKKEHQPKTPPVAKVEDKKEVVSKRPEKVKEEKVETHSREVNIILPKVPTPVKVNTINDNNISNNTTTNLDDHSIKFSKRYPPGYISPKDRKKIVAGSDSKTGEVNNGRISINLLGNLIDAKTAQEKLKKAGFEILAVTPLNKKKTLTSIVFTNDTLKKMASKKDREFLGTLRLLIDKKEKKIAITNPLYLSKAFLQGDFDEANAKKLLESINKEFPKLTDSLDKFKFQGLPNYQFMEGMPHYKDMVEIASGADLLEKIKDNKKVVFVQKLFNGSTLIGVKLSKRTSKFPNRVGTINAGMLPYPIVISNGVAKTLDPKYYISVMYPDLKMEEFMTIATIPGAIIKDCERVFR